MTIQERAEVSTHYDIAIVGGGISGVYAAWRLLTAAPGASEKLKEWTKTNGKLKVVVFEGSDRVGGRLLSARPPGFSKETTCEIGGMRYLSSQTLIRSLVENALELPHYEQVPPDQPNNIVYLRGKQLRLAQVQDPSMLPYNLAWAEAQLVTNNNPAALIGWAIGKLLPSVKEFAGDELRDHLKTAKVDGVGLYQLGFWNLLARALSPDAYAVARSLIGYDCLGSNANAFDLICEYFDFTPDVRYYLLNKGYECVPWILQKRFEDAGGEVIHRAWIAGFDKTSLDDGSTGVVLDFADKRPPVLARAIILAMPRRSLELLERKGPVFGPAQAETIQPLLNSVRAIPLYKLFVVYDYPWWNAVGVSKGRSLTDTAVRQLYYWPVDPGAAAPSATGQALLMAYNDATNVDFWGGLSGAMFPSMNTPAARQHFRRWPPGVPTYEPKAQAKDEAADLGDEFGKRLRENWDGHKAPIAMVMEMHRQLIRIHDIQYAPEPIAAACKDWSQDPYGGGVHLWNRGYRSWKKVDEMIQPVHDFPCYICGEAYSTNQTWVEGALETAETVLQKHFGLEKPSWVTPNPKKPNQTQQRQNAV